MTTPPIVPRHLVGHIDSAATPSLHPDRLGSVVCADPGRLVAWSWTTLHLRYVVGHHGLDDRGGLKIVLRFPYDGGDWQTDDATAPNFVRVHASRPCRFRCHYEGFGDARPWFRVFRMVVLGGCLGEGDTVDITLGDVGSGSPGLRVQSFCEAAWELRVLVDPCATGHYQEVPGTVAFAVVPGRAVTWRAVLPGRRPEGATFWLGLKAEDIGGNPTADGLGAVRLRASQPVLGLPETVEGWGPDRALRLNGLTTEPGLLRITVLDAESGEELATSNPMIVGDDASWWADLHGQSGETVGINTADAWFHFASDLAFLDATAHQANCFQINNAFWSQLAGIVEAWNEPGRHVTLHGYEWSGNTAVGGDRNVWYRTAGRPIRRASHALLTDHSDEHTDATTARALFAALTAMEQAGDVVVAAHVGGRHADLAYAHDGKWERLVEVHSAWGSFEWLLLDALRLGHRVGVVGNSDGHKGRPGASWPGAATFGAVGGLTGWTAADLDRDSLFDAMRERHTWATSGSRIDLRVIVTPDGETWCYNDDPAVTPTATRVRAERLTIGAIASTRALAGNVTVRVRAPSGVLRVEVRVGEETVHSVRPYHVEAHDRRVRLTWEGAEYRGRGRQTSWDGNARLTGVDLRQVRRFADWNPARGVATLATEGGHVIRWTAVTTGNRGGLDLWWSPRTGGSPHIDVTTGPACLSVALNDLPGDGLHIDAGGLGRRLSLEPLPEQSLSPDVDLELHVPFRQTGDTPIWVVVTCEDGYQAWSSPIYLVQEPT